MQSFIHNMISAREKLRELKLPEELPKECSSQKVKNVGYTTCGETYSYKYDEQGNIVRF